MSVGYFDESIHERAGFILGVFVFSERNANPRVRRALIKSGFDSASDEFKSGRRFDGQPRLAQLRDRLLWILRDCRVALVVVPSSARSALGFEALEGLRMFRDHLPFGPLSRCYFDQGVFPQGSTLETLSREYQVPADLLVLEQDSRQARGIQLADLAAHTCATMLLSSMGHVRKEVVAGPNSGYDPEMPMDLGIYLWAGVRHSLLARPIAATGGAGRPYVAMQSCGLHISERCSPELREQVIKRFGRIYIGCIH